MAQIALRQVASVRSLSEAWRRLNRAATGAKRLSAGVDDQTVADFSRAAERHLTELSRDLLAGRFSFRPLRMHTLIKPNGKKRIIAIPCVRDRIVQRALLDYLHTRDKYTLANELSYGFIRGKSVRLAVERACALRISRPWAYKTDIQSFFDCLSRDDVARQVTKLIHARSLRPLLLEAIHCEIRPDTPQQGKDIKRSGIRKGRGVRQGMPLSPYFANLVLSDFDALVAKKKISMVRYADDLIFFASSEEECRDLHEFCRESLKGLELQVPDIDETGKSRIYPPDEAAEFLGVGLSPRGEVYRPELTKEQLASIKTDVFLLADLDYLLSRKITISRILRMLDGKLAGYRGAYDFCANCQALFDTLESARSAVLRDLFGRELGFDLDALGPRQRSFLELL